jgi:hypothetical protein
MCNLLWLNFSTKNPIILGFLIKTTIKTSKKANKIKVDLKNFLIIGIVILYNYYLFLVIRHYGQRDK